MEVDWRIANRKRLDEIAAEIEQRTRRWDKVERPIQSDEARRKIVRRAQKKYAAKKRAERAEREGAKP